MPQAAQRSAPGPNLVAMARAATDAMQAADNARQAERAEAQYAKRITRDQYEAECAARGWAARSDSSLRFCGLAAMDAETSMHHRRYLAYAQECERACPTDDAATTEAGAVPVVEEITTIARRTCACGHTVPTDAVMSTTRGSSCPECYDRMSE